MEASWTNYGGYRLDDDYVNIDRVFDAIYIYSLYIMVTRELGWDGKVDEREGREKSHCNLPSF